MALFEVYTRENTADVEFVSDRVSVFALVLPAIWLVWHRLWYALAVYGLIALTIAALGSTQWGAIAAAMSFLPGLYLFLEGSNLIGARLERQEFSLAGLVEADSRESAELQWVFDPGHQVRKEPLDGIRKQAWPASKPVEADLTKPEFGMFGANE